MTYLRYLLKSCELFLLRLDSAVKAVFVLFFLLLLSGCATVKGDRIWAEDATFRPGWQRIKNAAVNAALDPVTWIPLSGALILQIDHMDETISDYASDHTPLFGSRKKAAEASDNLRNMTRASYYTTVLLTNGGDNAPDYFLNKTKGLLVGELASTTDKMTTSAIKGAVGRERPSGLSDSSFPSGHSSSASLRSTLTCRNIDYLPLSKAGKTGLKWESGHWRLERPGHVLKLTYTTPRMSW